LLFSLTSRCFLRFFLACGLWKESYIVPLSKSGDKRNFSNYRGISILSAIPKLFEKLVCDVITPIICPLISDEQHGFVGGCSTVTSFVEFSNFVLSEMEDGFQWFIQTF
jgi:hypothetical protein